MIFSNMSFIIIARNESPVIGKCLDSVAAMTLDNCEVICVDSGSTDDTLEVMKSYVDRIANLRVVQCSGFVNAAVARNAGMRFATKKYIFFVDGDVELYPDFISEALDRIQSGRADAVTGKLREIQYSSDYKDEIRRVVRRKEMTEEKKCLITGGIFIATRKIVDKAGTWDHSFVRLQDFDYTLRISRHGTLIQLPQFVGVHHTQEFHDRSWEHFRKGYPLLRGRLIRKNIDIPSAMFMLIRSDRGLATFLLLCIVLLCGLVMALLTSFTYANVGQLLLACLICDFLYSVVVKRQKLNQWLLHNYLSPPLILFGIFMEIKQQIGPTEIKTIVQ
ncbi:MAG: glycosyltransferase family 2 protein [Pirellulales bacterium]|nr:glycosyltransferase family 2 protein [Pirellulales bacterium]